MAESSMETVWAGTDNGVFSIFNAEIETFNENSPAANIQIRDCFISKDDTVYFISDQNEALTIESGKTEFAKKLDEKFSQKINAIASDHYGRLWAAFEEDGLMLKKQDKWLRPEEEKLRDQSLVIKKIASSDQSMLFYDGKNLYYYQY